MSGHWAALASASIIAALYGGMAAASGRMPALLHGRGRLLHMRAAQHPLRADRQRAGNECQQLSAGMNMSAPNGAAVWSSLQAFDTFSEDPRHPAQYYEFHNVRVQDGAIVFASPKDLTQWPVSSALELFPNVSVAVDYQTAGADGSSPLENCTEWLQQPAVLVHIPYARNVFHFMSGVASTLHTLTEQALVPAAIARAICGHGDSVLSPMDCLLPEASSDIVLVGWDRSVYGQRWSHLLESISSSRLLWKDLEGRCLPRLLVRSSRVLDFNYGSQWADATELPRRKAALQRFQEFAFRAALTHHVANSWWPSTRSRSTFVRDACLRMPGSSPAAGDGGRVPSRWLSGGDRPRVTLASRPRGTGRAVRNEDDIIALIRHQYDVDLVVTTFAAPLWDTMQLVRGTDVFLGMHGAGFTNLLWLSRGATVLQLFPYGWKLPDGSVAREQVYSGMAEALNATYVRWINRDVGNAHFRRQDFKRGNREWQEHPDHTFARPTSWGPERYWIYQETTVNMSSFGPALESAFARAGIPRRSETPRQWQNVFASARDGQPAGISQQP